MGDGRMLHEGKILVVEDNYLQAEVISDLLRDFGLEPVGPVGRLQQACQLARESALDGAVVDMKLRAEHCYPVCTILLARKVPFIFLTGHREPSLIPPEFRAAPLVCKPFEDDELRAALASISIVGRPNLPSCTQAIVGVEVTNAERVVQDLAL